MYNEFEVFHHKTHLDAPTGLLYVCGEGKFNPHQAYRKKVPSQSHNQVIPTALRCITNSRYFTTKATSMPQLACYTPAVRDINFTPIKPIGSKFPHNHIIRLYQRLYHV